MNSAQTRIWKEASRRQLDVNTLALGNYERESNQDITQQRFEHMPTSKHHSVTARHTHSAITLVGYFLFGYVCILRLSTPIT